MHLQRPAEYSPGRLCQGVLNDAAALFPPDVPLRPISNDTTHVSLAVGEPSESRPCLLILAAFSSSTTALDWAAQRGEAAWGPIAERSDRFAFEQTDYYAPTMGTGLLKQFFAFARPIDAGSLGEIKRLTNKWEQDYADQADAGGVDEAPVMRSRIGKGVFG